MPRTSERSRHADRRPSGRPDGAIAGAATRPLRGSFARIAAPTALAAFGAATYVSVVTPSYTGEATVLVEESGPGIGRPAADRIEAALTREVAREAARRMKLVGRPEFDPAAAEIGPLQQALMLLGIGQNPLDKPAEDGAADNVLSHLSVTAAGTGRVATVSFRSEDPQLAAQGANVAAELAVAALDRAVGAGPSEAAIATLRRRAAETDARVEAYRAQHGLAAGGQASGAQDLAELSNQLSMARLQRADLAGRIVAIKELLKDGRSVELVDVATTDSLRRLVDSRIAARAQLALESRTLLPAHPRIKGLKAQLSDLDAQIKLAAERAQQTMETEARNADARIADLQAAVDGRRGAGANGGPGSELAGLEREAKAARDRLDEALGQSAGAGGKGIARVVAEASVPSTASFPAALPIIGTTTLAAFLLSLASTLGRLFRRRTRRSDEPEAGLPLDAQAPSRAINPFALAEAVGPRLREKPASPEVEAEPVAEAGSTAEVEAEPAAETVAESPDRDISAQEPPHRIIPAPETERDTGFELDPLLMHLTHRAAPANGSVGRKIVVVDGGMSASGALHAALAAALLRSGSVIAVDLGAPQADPARPGFTDIIGGHADFADAIQADGPDGAHLVMAGLAPAETLFEEPRALAFTLEAMAEAYSWVVCRLHKGPDLADILALLATTSDTVVIASDADPADPALTDLYTIAVDAGAGQVLIAQDRPANPESARTVVHRAA
ncbi:GumC family protein [Methylobacterium aerolatum]|uniref:Uncharacterized protein involved in exopolysaccharide biosynthesis n=1 Tax=Methylobacterium aerolatum TaxID=418708 RepID=A0ABU0I4V1_9HYPH|nr:lipopolysaccharide biosynthesis protein [Methylobacterium aerolatum]MDQ0449112.1 uncharacterized protein involved in exopolysaccharide biosynthesis [Methylobacterium aerolatum]GJD35300.1 hypothetical protein FMGBMHLM_2209 [Methylobacterium aerolatum]